MGIKNKNSTKQINPESLEKYFAVILYRQNAEIPVKII